MNYKQLFENSDREEDKNLGEIMERAANEQDARVNKNPLGHVWIESEYGHVLIDGSSDFHNFIKCAKCGYVYCIACHDEPQKICLIVSI
jgi:hypothetical protein